MIIVWLLNSLQKEIADRVLFHTTAQEIWEELHQRFKQSNGTLIFQIQRKLYSLSQGSDDFSTYFTNFKRTWDELRSVQDIPTCSCDSAVRMKKFLEEQKLIQLLMGLNDSYKAIRCQILMMSPLPSLASAYSLIIHEERQREIHSTPTLNIEVLAMNYVHDSRSTSSSRKQLVCTNCKKNGHTKAQCYRLIGFPADFKFTKSKRVDSTVQNAVHDPSQISPDQFQQLIHMITNLKQSDPVSHVNSSITNSSLDSDGNVTDSAATSGWST